MAEYLDVAFGRIEQAEQDFDRRGFARAIRAQETEHLATPDLEIDVIDGLGFGPPPEVLEDFRQPANRDDSFTGGRIRAGGLGSCDSDHENVTPFGRPVAAPVPASGPGLCPSAPGGRPGMVPVPRPAAP